MTTALITIGICIIALGLMFRSLYLNDLRIKQEQKRQEMQEELDRQNLGETFDGDLEDWIIKATHKANYTPIEQAPLFRDDDFGGQSGDIPMQKPLLMRTTSMLRHPMNVIRQSGRKSLSHGPGLLISGSLQPNKVYGEG